LKTRHTGKLSFRFFVSQHFCRIILIFCYFIFKYGRHYLIRLPFLWQTGFLSIIWKCFIESLY
jgi:hypothetical protein